MPKSTIHRHSYTHEKKLTCLFVGTSSYLPRRVAVSIWVRWFCGHRNPVREYLHSTTGAEGKAVRPRTSRSHWSPQIENGGLTLFAPRPPPLLYDHRCVFSCVDQKQEQIRSDVCHLAGTKMHVYLILLSFSSLYMFAKLLTNSI